MKNRQRIGMTRLLAVLMILAMFLTACGSGASSGGSGGGTKLKMAMILPGTVEDSDYNFVGYQALQALQKDLGVEFKHQEKVTPADAERVARGFINDGYGVIAFHGGQFVTTVTKLAPEFPKVSFIMESGGPADKLPANVWNIGRRFYEGFYTLGALAAQTTKSGKIGVIAGTKLPDFVASINAMKQVTKSLNPKAEILYTFVGDQNDPVKARQAAEAQVSQGVDFIILIVNLGAYGVVEAVKDKPVLLTTYYTDKTNLAPKNFAASLLTDFTTPYKHVVSEIQKGHLGGYEEMRPGNGFSLSKLTNVPADTAKKVEDLFKQVSDKKVQITEKTDAVVD